jgi:hypothetical protein
MASVRGILNIQSLKELTYENVRYKRHTIENRRENFFGSWSCVAKWFTWVVGGRRWSIFEPKLDFDAHLQES